MTVTPLNRSAEPPAFDDFYRHYFVRVLVLVRRHFPKCDAEEIAQETMARCLTNYETLDHGRDPWPWVNSVARNAAIDSMRRNRRLVPSDEVPEAARESEDATYDAVLSLERRRSVRNAMKKLHPTDRQLVEDHEFEGMGYTEMAALRDMTPNALRQRLFRARTRLAVELRRVGAALGVVPAAAHVRFGRYARKANDYSYAMGPVSASALSAAAVAGVATLATVFGPGALPVSAAMSRPSGEVVAAVENGVAAERTAEARAAAAARRAAVITPLADPPPPPSIVIPVTYEDYGDPTQVVEPWGHTIKVENPADGSTVYEWNMEYYRLPGQPASCGLGLPTCLKPGDVPQPPKP